MNSQYNLPAQFSGRADIQKVIDSLDPDDWCGDESMIHALQRAIAAIEQDRAALVPDFYIKLQAQIQHMLNDCVTEETHDELTFYTVGRSVTSSNLIGALMRLFAAAPQPQPAQPCHHDDLAVDEFAAAMKSKLADARAKGRAGWEECSQTELSRMLREHVEKGDPRDVANFAMFLWSRGYGIVAQPASQQKDN